MIQRATVAAVATMLLATPASILAQGVTTGAMNGSAMEAKIGGDKNALSEGIPVPGASIEAVHLPSGTKYNAVVRPNGRFFIPNVRVGGPYRVTIKKIGFKTQERNNIMVELGQNLQIDFLMVNEDVKVDEVKVFGERNALISSGRTGAAQNVSKDQIQSFPTISRSFQDFTKFSPQVAGNSVGGRNNRFNNIQIDGTQYNDLFGLAGSGTPGGQAGTNPISLDALQEFQVVVAPYDVRQGRFSGGGINAVTRSGTNNWEGSAYYFFRNEGFTGDLAATRYNAVSGSIGEFRDTIVTSPFPNFTEFQSGFRVGGPLIENKLFFFLNGELTGRTQPRQNTALLTRSANDIATARNLISVIDSAARANFSYNPGATDALDAERPSTKLFARLDWNIDDNHKATLRHNFVDASDEIFSPSNTNYLFGSRLYTFTNNVHSTVFQLNSMLGEGMSNELIVGYTRIRDRRSPSGNPFPTVIITDPSISNLSFTLGSENFSVANELDQDIFEITNNFTWYLDDHVLTVGTQNEIFSFRNLFIRDYYGTYTFNSVSQFVNREAARLQYSFTRPGIDPQFAAKFSAMQLGFYVQDEWSVTPKLKITAGLRLDMPLLPDAPNYNTTAATITYNPGTPKAGQALGLRTDRLPTSNLLFSPRLGFNYDVSGDRTTQIRGGVGLFSGRVPFVWISNQYSNTGVEFARLDLRAGANTQVPFYDAEGTRQNYANPARPGVSNVTEVNYTSEDFKMPQTLRMNLAVDHQLPFGIVATVEGIYSKTLNDIYYRDINLGERQNRLTGWEASLPGGRGVFGAYAQRRSVSGTVNGQNVTIPGDGTVSTRNTTPNTQVGSFTGGPFNNIVELSNTSEGYQYQVSVQLQKNFDNGLYANVAYTYGESYDQNSGLSSQAISNWRFNYVPDSPNDAPLTRSRFDIPHRFIASLSYGKEYFEGFKTSISLFYEGRSGLPFSYSYDGDINADGQTENDLIYVPRDINDIALVRVSTLDRNTSLQRDTVFRAPDNDFTALDKYIQRDEYLNSVRGQMSERNGARSPFQHQLDLRFAQEFPNPFVKGQRLEFTVDVINFLNMLNREWGRVEFVNNDRDLLLRFEGIAQTGNTLGANGTALPVGTPLFSYRDRKNPFDFRDSDSRWQMQIGIRYSF